MGPVWRPDGSWGRLGVGSSSSQGAVAFQTSYPGGREESQEGCGTGPLNRAAAPLLTSACPGQGDDFIPSPHHHVLQMSYPTGSLSSWVPAPCAPTPTTTFLCHPQLGWGGIKSYRGPCGPLPPPRSLGYGVSVHEDQMHQGGDGSGGRCCVVHGAMSVACVGAEPPILLPNEPSKQGGSVHSLDSPPLLPRVKTESCPSTMLCW